MGGYTLKFYVLGIDLANHYVEKVSDVLRIILDKLGTNVSPKALTILSVVYDAFPRSFFDNLLGLLAKRIKSHNIVVIDDTHVKDAIRTIFINWQAQISRSKVKAKGLAVDIVDILTKQKPQKMAKETKPQKQIELPKKSEASPKPKLLAVPRQKPKAEERLESQEEPQLKESKVGETQNINREIFEPSTHAIEKTPEIDTGGRPPKDLVAEAVPQGEARVPPEKSIPQIPPAPKATEVSTKTFEALKSSIRITKNISWYLLSDSPESFKNYFLSRYEKLRRILEKQVSGRILDSLDPRIEEYKDSYLVLIVDSKEIARNERGGIIIGDTPYSRLKVYIPFDIDPDLKRKFDRIVSDIVIALKIRNARSKKFAIATDIVFPDLPRIRTRNRANKPTKIIVAGDIHLGSKQFMKENFENFIRFLRGETGNEELDTLANEIEYILLAGDLVDGVGVYPQQKDELAIFDQKEQYQVLAEYLSKIPDDKLIIAIPGNHDASTRLIPQPPVSEKIAEPLYELPTLQILSNPAMIDLRGVKILMYHGQGFERLAGILGIKLENIHSVVAEALRWRHLCPTWGLIPQAPTYEDNLVIEEEPDIVITGHVHICDLGRYRGTAILSAGSFEGLTTWQRDIGITPTVGYFHILDLQTYNIITMEATQKTIRIARRTRL